MISLLLYFLLIGSSVGFLSGLLGIGGGLISVPALSFLFSYYHLMDKQYIIHMAIATSLASIVCTSTSAAWAHHKKGAVLWPIFWKLLPGVTIGALILGPLLFNFVSNTFLRYFFAIFCLCNSTQSLLSLEFTSKTELPSRFWVHTIGLFIGTVSTLLGIGGGGLAATFLNIYHVPLKKVVGTTTTIAVPIAVAGTIGFLNLPIDHSHLPAWSSNYIYWPAFLSVSLASVFFAPLGTYYAHKLPVALLKKLFSAMIFIVGLKMLFHG